LIDSAGDDSPARADHAPAFFQQREHRQWCWRSWLLSADIVPIHCPILARLAPLINGERGSRLVMLGVPRVRGLAVNLARRWAVLRRHRAAFILSLTRARAVPSLLASCLRSTDRNVTASSQPT
jgi:hypothetical protein